MKGSNPRTTRRARGRAAAPQGAAPRLDFVEDEVAGLAGFVGPGDVCPDTGAEHGLHTWALSALAGPYEQGCGVEPLPGPARRLRHTARTLGRADVAVHRTALGPRTGHGTPSPPRRHGIPVHGRAHLTEGAAGPGPNAEFRTSRPVRTTVRTPDQLVARAGLEKYGSRPSNVARQLGYHAYHLHGWSRVPDVVDDCRNHLFTA
ncbi:FkbM family methyltransferase [Streptomyces sp. NPDC088745]|uniref:FkbM family methyltransferase n=1 Tax=Streptomyces sp. NPDC088745 TaxID=3365884 RepID=UPI003800B9E4